MSTVGPIQLDIPTQRVEVKGGIDSGHWLHLFKLGSMGQRQVILASYLGCQIWEVARVCGGRRLAT